MATMGKIEIRIADWPQAERFFRAVAALTKALDQCDDLPEPVTAKMNEVRQAAEAFGQRAK